jgi:hypothetical protein
LALDQAQPGRRLLYVALQWHAREKPAGDYKVTLRLLDEGGRAVAQNDGYPIGPLLPPSTWDAGDDKPGYMVLEIPDTVPTGRYDVAIGLYDPTSLQLKSFAGGPVQTSGLVKLSAVNLDSAGGASVVQ